MVCIATVIAERKLPHKEDAMSFDTAHEGLCGPGHIPKRVATQGSLIKWGI